MIYQEGRRSNMNMKKTIGICATLLAALLCAVPLIGFFASVWVLPYWNMSCLLKYEAITASQPAPAPLIDDEDSFL